MVFSERTFHGEKPVVETLHPNAAESESAFAAALAAAGGIDATTIEVVAGADGFHLKGTVGSQEEMEKCLLVGRKLALPVINELQIVVPEM